MKKQRNGFVSIEVIIIASMCLIGGFAGMSSFLTGGQDTQKRSNEAIVQTTQTASSGFTEIELRPEGDQQGAADTTVYIYTPDSDAITDALTNGYNVVVGPEVDLITVHPQTITNERNYYNGHGSTVTMNGQGISTGVYGYLQFAPDANEVATLQDFTVTGSGFLEFGHYGKAKGTYTANNITVKDMIATLTITDNGNKTAAAFTHYGTATLNNCHMSGTMVEREGYTPYDAGFVNKTKTTVNGGEYGSIYLQSQAHATIYNAKVGVIDSAAITVSNLGKLTIGAGTTVDIINLKKVGNYKPALVIEEGAVVGKITFNGVEYTAEEWMNR